MKKLLFFASFIFVLMVSFTLPTPRMIVNGTVEDSALNGVEVVLFNYSNRQVVEKTIILEIYKD